MNPQQTQPNFDTFVNALGVNPNSPTPAVPSWSSKLQGLYSKSAPTATTPVAAAAPTPSLGDNAAAQYEGAASKIGSSIQEGADKMSASPDLTPGMGVIPAVKAEAGKVGNLLETGLGTAAGGVQALFAPLTATVQTMLQHTGVTADKVLTPDALKALSDFSTNHPELAKNIQDAITVGTAGLGEGALGTLGATDLGTAAKESVAGLNDAGQATTDALNAGVAKVGSGAAAVKDAVTPSTKTPESIITDKYTKAIKPTVVGQKTGAAMDAYNNNVVTGVKAIAQNKDNLSFADGFGNTETGRTPQSPKELADAITQTKSEVFNQYDALAKAAGDKGAVVDSKPVGDALDKIINSEALQVTNPSAIRYATQVKSRLMQQGPDGVSTFKSFDTKTAQDIVKNYNSSLEAFYKNPSYDSATKAAIDAGVASQFRTGLDDAINSATGANYAALKQTYGALSAIEKDVSKRALVLARQSGGGLGKYIDIFSGGDMVDGLLSLSPTRVGMGALKIGANHLFQYLNSPDRAIQAMFKATEAAP